MSRNKPTYSFQPENIPAELKSLKQWVLFRLEPRGDKWSKVPCQLNGHNASVTNSRHWTTFEKACESLKENSGFDGVGFVFTKRDGYCGTDLDNCVDLITKAIQPWAKKIVDQRQDSYIEYSLSGKGLHLIDKAVLAGGGVRKGNIEVYDSNRYFTMTGNIYKPETGVISNQQPKVDTLLSDISGAPSGGSINISEALQGIELSSEEIQYIIKTAREAKNGSKFSLLFDGKWESSYKSHSDADAALCSILDFWLGDNEVAIDQIFRESKLYRDKWEREDYRIRTIRNSREFKNEKIRKEFLDESNIVDDDSLPIIHISKIEKKPIVYQVEKIWCKSSVGYISGLPGTFKTWVAWDIGLSVAAGSKVFGCFQAKKGKVIAFNAEDDPSTNIIQRLEALAQSKNISLQRAEFYLIKVNSLHIDNEDTRKLLENTIKKHKPDLIILDPFVALHMKEENSASEISPLLDYLRVLNREYSCSILIVCHDRKDSGSKSSSNRESKTRGSNVIHGWRDTAIFIDKKNNAPQGVVGISLQHRGAPPVDSFSIKASILGDSNGIESAHVEIIDEMEVKEVQMTPIKNKILQAIQENGPMTRAEIIAIVKSNKKNVLEIIKRLVADGDCIEGDFKEGTKSKLIWFSEPKGTSETGTHEDSSSSPPL